MRITRKQAIHQAISALAEMPEYSEVVEVLQELSDELPFNHWSEAAIHDTIRQFILDNGRNPIPNDFKRAGMPPHTVIQNRYGMTLKEWLDIHYPVYRMSYEERKEAYTARFIEDYYRIKPKSETEFMAGKRPDTIGWQSVAKYHHVKTWRNLVKALDLPLYFDMHRDHQPREHKVRFILDDDFWD